MRALAGAQVLPLERGSRLLLQSVAPMARLAIVRTWAERDIATPGLLKAILTQAIRDGDRYDCDFRRAAFDAIDACQAQAQAYQRRLAAGERLTLDDVGAPGRGGAR